MLFLVNPLHAVPRAVPRSRGRGHRSGEQRPHDNGPGVGGHGVGVRHADSGSSAVTATFTTSTGVMSAASGAGVAASGGGTPTVVLDGQLADIRAFIAGGGVRVTAATAGSGVITGLVSDNGTTGSGGVRTACAAPVGPFPV